MTREEELETRIQELLAVIVKLSRKTPYPEEAEESRSHVRTLIAEVGTLRASNDCLRDFCKRAVELANRYETECVPRCPCGNEARYIVAPNTTVPTLCGVCDILKNGGNGVRR